MIKSVLADSRAIKRPPGKSLLESFYYHVKDGPIYCCDGAMTQKLSRPGLGRYGHQSAMFQSWPIASLLTRDVQT